MELAFELGPRHHGKGPIVYAWHPTSQYVASVGSNRVIHVFDRQGKMVDQVGINANSGPVIGLEWNCSGRKLAILQGGSREVMLWHFETKELLAVSLASREPIMLKWSCFGRMLAVGTAKGEVLIYDTVTRATMTAGVRHKKRVTCGDWSHDNNFAFGSDDRQITIIAANGSTMGQVRVKSRPTNIKFGSNDDAVDNMVSVSMDRKTIMLCDLDDPENALELAFEPKYGHVAAFHWFRDARSGRNGYIIVGFSQGYVVVISTHMLEVGCEQFCARFFRDSLKDLARSPAHSKVAMCGESVVKIVSMDAEDWEVEYESDELERSLENLRWTLDGQYVAVSSTTGHLYVFEVDVDGSKQAASAAAAASKSTLDSLNRRLTGRELAGYAVLVVVCLLGLLQWALGASASQLADVFYNPGTL